MKKAVCSLRGNSRGSGVVTVLIAMLFISALGAALLFTSYTGYQVKIAGRRAAENFYDAETAVSEVRAGVQKAVTESLKTAYTDVLERYSALVGGYENGKDLSGNPLNKTDSGRADYYPTLDTYLEGYFQKAFAGAMLGWQNGDGKLIKDGAVNAELLRTFLSAPPEGDTVSLAAGGYSNDAVSGVFKLRDIAVSYTDAKGYKTNITTDIAVTLPPFSYAPAGYLVSGLDRYALIALGGLDCKGNFTLSGNANVGGVTVTGAGFTYQDGTLVSKGDVSLGTGGRFTMVTDDSAKSELWAGGVTLSGNGSAADLSGDVYVANDLTLNGANTAVRLTGSYYGFGSDSTDAAKSSAILVNGRNTTLNMAGLQKLMIAGSAFIDAEKAMPAGSTYLMGQSVATRGDQLAYLVPKSCLAGTAVPTNPSLVTAQLPDSVKTAIMGNITELAKTKTYYGNVSGVKPAYVNLKSDGTQQVVYFFMTFADQADANAFFRGYFADNKSEITSYLGTYAAAFSAPSGASSAGEAYSGTLAALGLTDASNVNALASSYQTAFKNIWLTGSRAKTSGAADPYAAAVNTAEVDTLTGANYFTVDGNNAAVIAKGNYTYNYGESSNIHIIIATGDVTVNGSYTGLILCRGKLTMNGSVTYNSEQVLAALQATAANGRTVLSYLNDGSNTVGSGGAQTGGSWDVDALVGYSNWKKS